MERTLHPVVQHRINWEETGMTREEFVAAYSKADDYTQRAMIESVPLWTNPKWLELRAGRFGCSRAAEFLADPATKAAKEAGEMGETAKKTAYMVMATHLTSWREPEPSLTQKCAVKRGLIFEPTARALAEKKLGITIKEAGIFTYGDWFCYSPDGLDANDPETGFEIKTYEPAHFYETIMTAGDRKVQMQMQMQMRVGGLKRIFLVLYCPEVDPDNVFVLRYTRGTKYQAQFEKREVQMIEYIAQVQAQVQTGEILIPGED